MSNQLQAIEILLDSARGRFIPRDFANDFNFEEDGWQGVSAEDREVLANPDNECYWEVWDKVLNNATYITKCGKEYTLHQDGDLFAICIDELTETQRINLGWEL